VAGGASEDDTEVWAGREEAEVEGAVDDVAAAVVDREEEASAEVRQLGVGAHGVVETDHEGTYITPPAGVEAGERGGYDVAHQLVGGRRHEAGRGERGVDVGGQRVRKATHLKGGPGGELDSRIILSRNDIEQE
jgi:hypothetical protein